MLDLQERFRIADIDGNGRIDKAELRKMLESVEGGRAYPLLLEEGWLPEDRVEAAMRKYDIDNSGDIDFEEFKQMVYDGLFLEGTIQEYEEAFAAVDKSGNGSIGATELAQLFKNLGRPVGIDRIAEIFMKYDKDESGQIEFGEFMLMFRDKLLDMDKIKSWNAGAGLGTNSATASSVLETESGAVSVVFTAEEVEEVLTKHKDQLVVLFCGLTWCRPCKGVAKSYERLAEQYDSAVFLKLYGNANMACKGLFKQFKIRSTPSFLYFRNGELIGSNTGANKERLETNLRSHLTPAELEGKEPLYLQAENPVAA